MPQIVWTARPDGYIDYYNERWYEYTGFARGQYGQSSWAPILHPDDLQRCIDTYFGCIRTQQPYQIEYRFRDARSGGYRWFMGRALPIRDERGRVTRWFGTCTDIDDAKKVAESLRESNELLSRFNRLAVDRELRMIELKKEVNGLCRQCGEAPRYLLKSEADRQSDPGVVTTS
ncbi:MAG: PAS domain-containing protein [Gammaproteobacteria bacterium]|nr:PAS domain-containing protein [Gammaproteobacteria bacterium]